MFAQGTILIDRSPDEVYAALADLKRQIVCWDMLQIPGLDNLGDGALEADGFYVLGRNSYSCTVELHLTRPPSGLVTHLQWASGELAAEWRILSEGDRTRVEVNVEGRGGGLANNINLRQMTPKLLARLKQIFDKA